MIVYKDRAFCKCGKCDRSLTEADRQRAKELGFPISLGNLCNGGHNESSTNVDYPCRNSSDPHLGLLA